MTDLHLYLIIEKYSSEVHEDGVVFIPPHNYLDLDFIDNIRVILCLEREFDIKLPDDFLDDASTVGDVIDKLKKTI